MRFKKKLVAFSAVAVALLLSGCGSMGAQQIAKEQNGGGTRTTQQQNQQPANNNHQQNHSFGLTGGSGSEQLRQPADKFIMPTITPNVKKQLTAGGAKLSYNSRGAINIMGGPQLNTKVSSAPYVQLPHRNPQHGDRLEGSARAWLNHSSRQYQNRQTTGNGRGSFKPVGFIQRMNLNPGMSGLTHLYDRGHLIAYAIAGNVRGFDASESNPNNIVTQTAWANEARGVGPAGTGQNYYEGIVRQKLDQNDQIMYQVTPIYDSPKDIIPRGIHLQAANKYEQLFNVYVPNAQNGVEIDYHTGHSKIVGTN